MIINIDTVPVCVINLPERTERLARTEQELHNFYSDTNIKDGYYLIPGVKHRNSYTGIATAHLKAIQMAKDNNWEFVVVCEDDIHFQSKHSKSYAIEAFKQVPEDFDILLAGIYTTTGLVSKNNIWNKTGEFSGTHFYVVHNKAYDKILSFDKLQHIDRWFGRQKDLNCYVTKEFFAIQYDGFSDNAGMEREYYHLLAKFKLLK